LKLIVTMNKVVLFVAFAAATVLAAPNDGYVGNDGILLSDIQVLKFNAGETALNTRTPDVIPRLACAYNPLGNDMYLPSSVTCKNKGMDDNGGIIWKCDAEMDSSLAFDNIQVSCEGYRYPGDEYIRKGSCALTYTLKLTADAKVNEPRPTGRPTPPPPGFYRDGPTGKTHAGHYRVRETKGTSLWTFSNVLILVLVAVLIYRCCLKKKAKKTFDVENPMEKSAYDNVSNNNTEPSAPPYEDVEGPSGSVTKRSGYAETVSR